tara:strand:+ start:1674 stop:2351 length:678 start_codon:yes stop_codon:yes gene_type:complete
MKKKKSFFLWLVILVFLTTYNLDLSETKIGSLFNIKKIEIYGIENSNKEEIQKKINEFNGKNIILTSDEQFKSIIDASNFIKAIEIKKVYPDEIKIIIKEFSPIGIFIDEESVEYILLEEGKIIDKSENKQIRGLPLVYGKNASKNFFTFYKSLEATSFDTKLVKQFNYFDSNRWDMILKDDRLVKLPSVNYEKSLKEFLSIYTKESFKKFKVFDFRVSNELIVK